MRPADLKEIITFFFTSPKTYLYYDIFVLCTISQKNTNTKQKAGNFPQVVKPNLPWTSLSGLQLFILNSGQSKPNSSHDLL